MVPKRHLEASKAPPFDPFIVNFGKITPHIPHNGGKSSEKTLKTVCFRRYCDLSAKTPKVGALPASRTAFHTTRGVKNAILGRFLQNYGCFRPPEGGKWSVIGGIWGSKPVKNGGKIDFSKSTQDVSPVGRDRFFGLYGHPGAPQDPCLPLQVSLRSMPKLPKIGHNLAKMR